MNDDRGSGRVELRSFRTGDQEQVKALILDSMLERWGHLDDSLNPDLDDIEDSYGHGVILTGWLDQRLVATATLVPQGERVAEVVRMSVARGCRRQGIASRLLTTLLAHAPRLGATTVQVETTATWADARAFYEAHGFVLHQLRPRPFGEQACYRLTLSASTDTALP